MDRPELESSSPVSGVISGIEARAGLLYEKLLTLHNSMSFNELLVLAEDICLEEAPAYPKATSLHGEAAVVAQLGSRGLKTAFEIAKGYVRTDRAGTSISTQHETGNATKPEVDEDDEDTKNYRITLSLPMRHPELFSGPQDTDAIVRAEAFGAQLIKESFKILGHDAYQKATDFANAHTAGEQMKIIRWLDKRLRLIGNNPRFAHAETASAPFYHPARLSPKLVGTYPHMNLDSTCLGVSVIATSFFVRASAPTLHADVMRSSKELIQYDIGETLREVPELCQENNIPLQTPISQSIEELCTQVVRHLGRPDGNHVATYTRLVDGTWAQFDSNFGVSLQISNTETIATLDECLTGLAELHPVAPGLEVSATLSGANYEYENLAEMCRTAIAYQDPAVLDKLQAAVSEEFDKDTTESFTERIFHHVDEIAFSEDLEGEDPESIGLLNACFKNLNAHTAFKPENLLRNSFYQVFHKYVLWGESPETFLKLVQTDASYRLNRLEDMRSLPTLMLITIARDSDRFSVGAPHWTVTLGLPAERIGLAVLSDIATYTNSPVSPLFWISNWPSDAALLEATRPEPSSTEAGYLFNNLVYNRVHPLTSDRNIGIIARSIVKLRGTEGGE